MNDPVPAFWQEDDNQYYGDYAMDRITIPSQWLDGDADAQGRKVAGHFPHLNLVRFDPQGRSVTPNYMSVHPGCQPSDPGDSSCDCEHSDPNVDTCELLRYYSYTCGGHGCPEIPVMAAADLRLSKASVAWIESDLAANWPGSTVLHGTGCILISGQDGPEEGDKVGIWADNRSTGSLQIGQSKGEGEWTDGPSDPGNWDGVMWVQFPGPVEPTFWLHHGTLTANLLEARPSIR